MSDTGKVLEHSGESLRTGWLVVTSALCTYRFKILQVSLLLLRFGQVIATGQLALIYLYFIFLHRVHPCRVTPYAWECRQFDFKHSPWQYALVPIAAGVSALQLFFATLISLNTASSSTAPRSKHKTYIEYLRLPLTPSDAIPLAVYIIVFICLSDYVVPSRILLGARDGTTCYFNQNPLENILLRECILGQHGYWWTMGAVLSYFITFMIWLIFAVRESSRKSLIEAIKDGRFRTAHEEVGSAEEEEHLLTNDLRE